jgi:predicted alpha/beta superfamily hydrolase
MKTERRSSKPITLRLVTDASSQPVYLAGNFNDWRPDAPEFAMRQILAGVYEFTFQDWPTLPHPIEYKYTRGSWDLEELSKTGEKVDNRQIARFKPLVTDHVPRWAMKEQQLPPLLLEVFSEHFSMKPLRRKRRISALLPPTYHASASKRYPVLYLLDGQNLAGNGSAFGNWELDKRIARINDREAEEVILVLIDHGEKNRLREYSPYYHHKIVNPQGDLFLQFLTDTLKPAIDRHYRTLPQRDHTGIGGSSMGGLFSAYAALKRPDVFSKAMVFSPSLWIAEQLFHEAERSSNFFFRQIYLYAGGREGVRTIADLKKLHELLQHRDHSILLQFSLDPKGRHEENRWGQEFEKALPWLFPKV